MMNLLGVVPTQWILRVATFGGLGNHVPAPGTFGSVAGVIVYTLFFAGLDPILYGLLMALFVYAAVLFCGEAESRLHMRDPKEVIIDEVAAMPICFIGAADMINALQNAGLGGWSWGIALLGFGIFRIFDILKPFGISRLQNLPGGWGVVMDDVAAGVITCVLLHLAWIFGIMPLLG